MDYLTAILGQFLPPTFGAGNVLGLDGYGLPEPRPGQIGGFVRNASLRPITWRQAPVSHQGGAEGDFGGNNWITIGIKNP
jgi:hypothetical protein